MYMHIHISPPSPILVNKERPIDSKEGGDTVRTVAAPPSIVVK